MPLHPHSMLPAADPGRRTHFAEFYGAVPAADRPIGLVMGNCQAESLRLALPHPVAWVRTPPVHELTAGDMPHLDRLVEAASVLISQPVRDDYHGLPIGTRQLFARVGARRGAGVAPGGAGSLTAVVPVIRSAALYPAHALVRPPSEPSLAPPLVPYHDLHVLAEAAGQPLPPLTVRSTRAVGSLSQRELRSREQRHGAVPVSDLFEHPSFDLMRTINHPGNPVWTELAARVAAHLGLDGDPVELERPLLNRIHAPRSAVVIEAWELATPATDHWTVDGEQVPDDEVRRAHLTWYGEHPEVVAAGVSRHAEALSLLADA
ncbi:WcbI family polysaccharide biosynthesis putative acetyltransferase [Herbiconiux sp. CPCC 203407]|uniref:WcbI family polysaccharide biosynthesis putative acetyltransferase n=1 Tax=Herbiconiux oxytropis TaxID=2970915 RepID=A0AA41XI71_9MICO|nr:WcbI family polysaccharide biosynthesis putative acetyltransferase [Herbiconiux oxytropis]MCS5723062.1 WcbI family polysaccharide biosynthesis putative acetyltransferase [Herbiconiux oxytropis]MCS5726869.1 WcbI family polysaccharide biosynthesis putative acetyltransferase [Herbiconiux oxytropis]